MIFFLRNTVAGALLLAFSCFAHAAINLGDTIPLDPQLKVGKLANGLTYYILKNGKPEKKVELRLVVKAGSILEDDDQQGLAHLTEHMAFDGSRHFKKHELISYLQSIGVQFGADLNANTGFDQTIYILPIPTDKKENLETGFQVLEDWAQGLTMNDAAIDKERAIVLEEARMDKGVGDRVFKALLPEEFNGSRYALRLPIGKEDIVKHAKYATIKRFYADWYRPDLMAVVVVGDVEPAQAEKMIQAHFSHLKNPVKERPRNYAAIPTRASSSGLVITDKEATDNRVLIEYPIQKVAPDTTIADYRKDLVKNLYTAMLNQRMQELTQQANPPFLSASSAITPLAPGYESFMSNVVLGRDGVNPAITAVVQENERARQLGFHADELERSKKSTLRFYERAYNERDKSESASLVDEYIRNFLIQETIPGIVNEYAYVKELLPGISLDEVNHYASQVTPGNTPKLVAYMGSAKANEPAPSRTQLLELVNTAEQAPVVAKAEKAIPVSLMAQAPQGGSIVSEQQNKELGITELTLSNGVKVILKPTDFKNDQVLISASRFGGQSLFDDKDMYNARYANAVAWDMGVSTFSPTDLHKILAGKEWHLQMNSGNYADSISGSAGSNDMESLFQLLCLEMSSPRRDDALFKAFVSREEDETKNAMSNPQAVFADTEQAILYNNHPRRPRVAQPADFGSIDLERAMAIHKERFGSARDLTFIIVGSFDPDKIKPLIATYLASLPTGDIVSSYKDMGIRPITGVVKRDLHIGADPKSLVSLTFTGPATYSKEEELRFSALIEVMNLRIIDVLREKLSLIYSGQMGGAFSRDPYGHYQIDAYLPCGPENTDKVVASMMAEIEKMKNEGPQQSDLDKVRQAWLKQRQIELRTNGYWLAKLQDATLYGTDPADILNVEKRINAITPDDVKEAARRYFNQQNYLQMVLYPEHAVH